MVSRVKRYFLEIKDFSKTVDLNLPENFQIILDDKDNFHLNRFFYKQIGVDHYWRDMKQIENIFGGKHGS